MLILGAPKQEIAWKEAGITLELVPLTEDKDQQFVRDTLTEVRDDKGKLIDIKRDVARYAQLIGRHCIRGWRGVIDPDGNPVPCRPDAIDQFMLIEPAQQFVIGQVRGLTLHLAKEVDEGKPGSAPSFGGAAG